MPRYALEVAYDGTDFQGSQGQTRPGARTVDGTLKNGLESLLGQAPRLLWASRTDSGVHAEANVCAFDAELPMPVDRLLEVLNRQLPPDLRIVRRLEVGPEFHPRFDAVSRSYLYRICSPSDDPRKWRFWWELEQPIDLGQMFLTARLFSGEDDFSAFAAWSRDRPSALCTVQELRPLSSFSVPAHARCPAPDLEIRISANRFLRHMVCRIIGALVAVGTGRLSNDDIKLAFTEKKRLKFKPAPAKGLTLLKVSYSDTVGYDRQAEPGAADRMQ